MSVFLLPGLVSFCGILLQWYEKTLEPLRFQGFLGPYLFWTDNVAEQEGFEPSSRVSGYTISSRARYDHFDTTPYSVPAAASSRLAQVLLCDSDMYYNRYSPFVKYFFKISFYFFRPAQHLGKAVPYWADRVNKKASKQGFRSKNLFDKAAGLNLICPPLPCLDASFYSGHSSPSQRPMKSQCRLSKWSLGQDSPF